MDWLPFDDEDVEEMPSSAPASSKNVFKEEENEVDYWEVNGHEYPISDFTEALIEALCK